jgi:hypothetical protein
MKRKSVSSSRPTFHLENLESRQLLSLTMNAVPVTISQAAISADPTLANCKTYDLQVTLDPGERWIATDMDAELTSGGFYNVSDANGGSTVPVKQLWSQHPQAQFDTFVSASNFQIPTVLGQFNPAAHNGGTFTSTSTNVAWGAVSDTGTGTFTVARLTFTATANGTITGDMGSTLTNANQLKPYSFTIKNGVVTAGNNTGGGGGGGTQLESISGHLFNDTNGNGKDDEHGVLAGFKVYLDKNNNAHFDTGEKYKLTDANGNYTFSSLTAGTYYVREVLPAGYRRTSSTGKYTVVLSDGVNGTHKDFGLTNTALLSGFVFNDKNSNGKQDSGEGGVAGFRLFLDANGNGKLDAGEKFADSDSTGYWVFKAVKHGTYILRIMSMTGYKAVGNTSMTVKLASGGTYTGRLFAEHKIA